MKSFIRCFSLLLIFLLVITSLSPGQQQPAGKSDLKILYAGIPGSQREKEFSDFLSQHFNLVQKENYTKLNESVVKPFDVVIVDAVDGDFKVEIPPVIHNYNKPTVLMSFKAGDIIFKAASKEKKVSGYM